MAAAVERFGKIDVIFNNAGISGEQLPIHESNIENWQKVRSINGDGAFYVLKYGIAAMLKTGGGAIVNTSSTNGLVGIPNIAPYTFTKWGVIGLTKSAAIEYAAHNSRVNAVAPTVVRTALVQKFIEDAADPVEMARRMENFNPMPGMPEPPRCRSRRRLPRIRRCAIHHRARHSNRRWIHRSVARFATKKPQ